MFPSEMVVLMAIATTSKAYGKSDGQAAETSNDYTSHLYESLIQRGYLRETGIHKYQLTTKGKVVVREFLHDNKTKVGDIISTLKELGIETRIKPEG